MLGPSGAPAPSTGPARQRAPASVLAAAAFHQSTNSRASSAFRACCVPCGWLSTVRQLLCLNLLHPCRSASPTCTGYVAAEAATSPLTCSPCNACDTGMQTNHCTVHNTCMCMGASPCLAEPHALHKLGSLDSGAFHTLQYPAWHATHTSNSENVAPAHLLPLLHPPPHPHCRSCPRSSCCRPAGSWYLRPCGADSVSYAVTTLSF